jgi:hypothetical protein
MTSFRQIYTPAGAASASAAQDTHCGPALGALLQLLFQVEKFFFAKQSHLIPAAMRAKA